jgi:hypothetical protein
MPRKRLPTAGTKKPAKKRVWAADPKNPKTLDYLVGTKELSDKQKEARLWWRDSANRKRTFDEISKLMVAGKGVREIRRTLRGVIPVGGMKVERLTKQIKEEWAQDDAENRKHLRATHARRLLGEIEQATNDRAWGPVFAGEATYGKVTGTILPENIHVHMDRVDLVQQVIGGLDDARLKELYERQLVREKMLEAAGLSVPVVRGGEVIDIDPSQVQTELESVLVERVEGDGAE